jgi:hypothetical protein
MGPSFGERAHGLLTRALRSRNAGPYAGPETLQSYRERKKGMGATEFIFLAGTDYFGASRVDD